MRRKVYTKDQILKAAYEVVEKEGFSGFTARNIAKRMGISTQPIYLEFKNMEDLKITLLKDVFNHLYYEVFPEVHTGDTLIDLGINYINFAKKQPNIYTAFFVEEYGGGHKMYDFSSDYFHKLVEENPKYSDLPKETVDALHNGTWIVVTGLATLMTSGIITPSQDEIVKIIESTIERIIEKETNIFSQI